MPTLVSYPTGSRKRFPTGAMPTPRHKLASSWPYQQKRTLKARRIVVPGFLEMWLNDQDGDCVTAEEAAAIAFYSVMLGLAEIEITDSTVLGFCNEFDVLNGADLTQVMDDMGKTGFTQNGETYKDGPYQSVDFSKEPILQSALEEGPVKIGIDSSALPQTAGNANGWYASGGNPGQYNSEDHCVGLWNYGNSSDLFQALGTSMPSGFPPTGYHLFTWSTVGVVDHDWIMSTCGEAWLRSPTTVGLGPSPAPIPVPPAPPQTYQGLLTLLVNLAAGDIVLPNIGDFNLSEALAAGKYNATLTPSTPAVPLPPAKELQDLGNYLTALALAQSPVVPAPNEIADIVAYLQALTKRAGK